MLAATRAKIAPKNFAIPEKDKYPIHDAKHARLALAFVAMHGSPEEKARVRAKVYAKYPEMGKESAYKKIKKAIEDLPTAGGPGLAMVSAERNNQPPKFGYP